MGLPCSGSSGILDGSSCLRQLIEGRLVHLSVQQETVDRVFFQEGEDRRPPFLPWRLAVCLAYVMEEVTEELIPEE